MNDIYGGSIDRAVEHMLAALKYVENEDLKNAFLKFADENYENADKIIRDLERQTFSFLTLDQRKRWMMIEAASSEVVTSSGAAYSAIVRILYNRLKNVNS